MNFFKDSSNEYYVPTDEELKDMDWEKYTPPFNKIDTSEHRKISKSEWKIRCFIHRVKKRIESFLSYFSDCNEE